MQALTTESRAGMPAVLMARTQGEELALPVPETRSGLRGSTVIPMRRAPRLREKVLVSECSTRQRSSETARRTCLREEGGSARALESESERKGSGDAQKKPMRAVTRLAAFGIERCGFSASPAACARGRHA